MTLRSSTGGETRRSVDLEPELHEGDGPIAGWIWWVVGAVIVFAAVCAPFQLYWPIGR